MVRLLAIAQGLYYFATGVWPLFSLNSFMAVTGPKTDKWLVQMVGLLAAAVGAPLLVAAWQGEVERQLQWVALLSAGAFLAIDVYYAARRVIGKIYLADAVLQVAIISGWTAALLS